MTAVEKILRKWKCSYCAKIFLDLVDKYSQNVQDFIELWPEAVWSRISKNVIFNLLGEKN